jgi:hypothetical protein
MAGETLEASFRAFSQTALLNPPKEDDDGGMFTAGEGGFDGFYGEAGGLVSGGGDEFEDEFEADPTSEEGRAAMMAHLDSILQVPPSLVVLSDEEQFDDGEMLSD